MKCSAPLWADKLSEFATAVYVKVGRPEHDARLAAADALVQAVLSRHQSHGVPIKLSSERSLTLPGKAKERHAP
jgi:LDH2 family malate/lactate/ureidoglycolate dehydrogenase